MTESKLLKENGWVVECESPFEIRHEDGSFATLNAAYNIVHELRKPNVMSSATNTILNLENTIIGLKSNGITTEYAFQLLQHDVNILKAWAGID